MPCLVTNLDIHNQNDGGEKKLFPIILMLRFLFIFDLFKIDHLCITRMFMQI